MHIQDLSSLQCDVCVLVFSVTDRRSFHRTAQLRLLLREAQPQTPIILAGNKSDLVRSREISSEGTWKVTHDCGPLSCWAVFGNWENGGTCAVAAKDFLSVDQQVRWSPWCSYPAATGPIVSVITAEQQPYLAATCSTCW